MARNYTSNDFYCMKCGNKGIPISRPKSLKREKMHRKKLYCCTCREEVNHIECKNSFEAEEFKINFMNGVYRNEAEKSVSYVRAASFG